MVGQLFTLVSLRKHCCVSRKITNDSGPVPIVVGEITEELPVVLGSVCNNFYSLIKGYAQRYRD